MISRRCGNASAMHVRASFGLGKSPDVDAQRGFNKRARIKARSARSRMSRSVGGLRKRVGKRREKEKQRKERRTQRKKDRDRASEKEQIEIIP